MPESPSFHVYAEPPIVKPDDSALVLLGVAAVAAELVLFVVLFYAAAS